MQRTYGRDLDLNLLRVFAVVAECGSVTDAASLLYVTQPAVSAAIRRLTDSVGEPLFARHGRGLALTSRGAALLETSRPHLQALVDAALSPPGFDPLTTSRTFKLGLSDALLGWLLPPIVARLSLVAPKVRLVVATAQFRNVGEAIATRKVDLALTVADELPPGVRRRPVFRGGFVCLFDPRHASMGRRGRLTARAYFAHEHVIVSDNGDLRGVVEDLLQKTRQVRCSLPSFAALGAVIDGTALLATVPSPVAFHERATRPHLRVEPLPFRLPGAATELLWPAMLDDDPAGRFVRDEIAATAERTARPIFRHFARKSR